MSKVRTRLRLRLRVKPLVFGLAAAVLVAAAVWFCASELNRGGACSVESLETLLVLPTLGIARG